MKKKVKLERRAVVNSVASVIEREVDKRDGQRAYVMAIKSDRLGTAFPFFIPSQLYGVMEVLGLLYQWPWGMMELL